MVTLEAEVKKKGTRVKVQDAALLVLYAGAALTLAIAAPNAVRFLKDIDPDFTKKRKPAYRLQQAFTRLKDRGLVRISENGKLVLTEKGIVHAKVLNDAEAVAIKKPARWDGKWRIVIFDVWERRRAVRDHLRVLLRKAGFERVQDSVWAHPYPCEEFVIFIRTSLKLGPGLLYIIADGIEHDARLRKKFDLP